MLRKTEPRIIALSFKTTEKLLLPIKLLAKAENLTISAFLSACVEDRVNFEIASNNPVLDIVPPAVPAEAQRNTENKPNAVRIIPPTETT